MLNFSFPTYSLFPWHHPVYTSFNFTSRDKLFQFSKSALYFPNLCPGHSYRISLQEQLKLFLVFKIFMFPSLSPTLSNFGFLFYFQNVPLKNSFEAHHKLGPGSVKARQLMWEAFENGLFELCVQRQLKTFVLHLEELTLLLSIVSLWLTRKDYVKEVRSLHSFMLIV